MKKFESLKSKLKKEDFEFVDGWFQRKVRPPGSMHQQQFQVSDCEDCRLSILDPSACVYIDECTNSWFFVGPCEASVFIRDCKGCTVVCCCRQFRMRDCRDCRIALWCESQPVIQSSEGIEFDCFPDWGYKGLSQQFEVMKFSVWNNNWWDVYDFTKKGKGLTSNYRYRVFSNEQLRKQQFLIDLRNGGCEFERGIVPLVLGNTMEEGRTVVFCVEEPYVNSFRNSSLPLIKAKRAKIGPNESEKLRLEAGKTFIFLEFSEEDMDNAKKFLASSGATLIRNFAGLSPEEYNMIFVPFKDQH